jgi:hypothetical protein
MHLREKSSESRLAEVMAKMKAHFLMSWAMLRGRDQCIKRSMTGAGSQTEGTLRVGGPLGEDTLHKTGDERVTTERSPIDVGQSHRNSRPMQVDSAV